MTQIDLEPRGGGGAGNDDDDRVIANGTVINGGFPNSKRSDLEVENNQPDYPAQSYNLPKEEEVDWLNKNALLERKASTRRNSNTISHSHSTSSSTSQRLFLNLKSKASIIGLPKPQNSCFVDCKVRRNLRPSKARFFPKRSRSIGKSSVPPSEPSSPKVSCIGRVRSKKETIIAKSRSLRFRNRSTTEETPVELTATKPDKTGFWSNVKAVFRIVEKKKSNHDVGGWTESPTRKEKKKKKKNVTAAKHEGISVTPVSEPPGLGGLKRFTSGRKSESWGGCEVDFGADESDSSERGNDSVFQRENASFP